MGIVPCVHSIRLDRRPSCIVAQITKAREALQEALDTRQIRMRALRKYIVRRSTQCFDQ